MQRCLPLSCFVTSQGDSLRQRYPQVRAQVPPQWHAKTFQAASKHSSLKEFSAHILSLLALMGPRNPLFASIFPLLPKGNAPSQPYGIALQGCRHVACKPDQMKTLNYSSKQHKGSLSFPVLHTLLNQGSLVPET